MTKCSFCIKFVNGIDREWYDEILTENDRFLVVAGVGPLADGYALVVSRRHEVSMATLPMDHLTDLNHLLGTLRPQIAKAFRWPILFEHGASCPAGGGGACIAHAHLHILPTDLNLDDIPLGDTSFLKIDSIAELGRFKGQEYLFLQLQNGSLFVGSGEARGSQWFRRIIAERLGMPEEWDYAVHQRFDSIRRTISGYRTLQL